MKAGSGRLNQECWIKVAGMDAELGQGCLFRELDQEAGSESLDQGGWIRTLDQAG